MLVKCVQNGLHHGVWKPLMCNFDLRKVELTSHSRELMRHCEIESPTGRCFQLEAEVNQISVLKKLAQTFQIQPACNIHFKEKLLPKKWEPPKYESARILSGAALGVIMWLCPGIFNYVCYWIFKIYRINLIIKKWIKN